MAIVEPGMEAMLETFIHETELMLEQLDAILLESERAKSLSPENINNVFRITHTIKGSAAMMSFDSISTLAHAVEDVFFVIRDDPDKLSLIFDTMFDLVLSTSDFLRVELEKLSEPGEYNEGNCKDLIDMLHEQAAILKGEQPATSGASGEPKGTEQAAVSAEEGVYTIRVLFEEDCQMENMRAFMLITQLQDCCEYITSIPENPEQNSELCAQIAKEGFLIVCKPIDGIDEVTKGIEQALNIRSYEVLTEEEQPAPPAQPEVKEEVAAEPEQAAPALAVKESSAAPAAAPPPAEAAKPGSGGAKQSLISVNQSKLDQLMDLVGEIVTAESMVVRNPDIAGLKLDNFTKSIRELRKLTDELQDVVMSMRMVPLSGTFRKMDRIVRDMCKKLDKKAELVTEGGSTEVDKTINDIIVDPLMHMIRNSMDHAIEKPEVRLSAGKNATGKITLSAKNVGGEIHIIIADDGKGLDPQVLLNKARKNGILTKPESDYSDKEIFGLIMAAGFSTNENITEFSGRGVGMDVVRKNIEQVGGSISINSEKGAGTTFTIKIPLTLAIVEGMNISVGKTMFTLPITSIKQSFVINENTNIIKNSNGSEMIMLRGECYPIFRLHRTFGIETDVTDLSQGILIQVEGSSSNACIFADRLYGEYQVVVKPFPAFFNKYSLKESGLSGCSILGDGSISLILDINNFLNNK